MEIFINQIKIREIRNQIQEELNQKSQERIDNLILDNQFIWEEWDSFIGFLDDDEYYLG